MDQAQRRNGLLIAIASEIELRACDVQDARFWTPLVVDCGVEVVLTGVGKSSAAGGVATVLDPSRHSIVVSIGLGGVLPGSQLRIGQIVVGESSGFADEGIETPDGYQTCSQMGFPPVDSGDAVPGDPGLIERLVGAGMGRSRIATVSTCSGTDERALEVFRRTGAEVEAMEGAAVGLVAHRRGVSFAEVRVVSNTTGNRGEQIWDMAQSLRRLREAFQLVCRLIDNPGTS